MPRSAFSTAGGGKLCSLALEKGRNSLNAHMVWETVERFLFKTYLAKLYNGNQDHGLKGLEEALFNGRLGRAVTQVIGKPGSLRLRPARDTLGMMITRALSMGQEFPVSGCLCDTWACRNKV